MSLCHLHTPCSMFSFGMYLVFLAIPDHIIMSYSEATPVQNAGPCGAVGSASDSRARGSGFNPHLGTFGAW